MKGGREREKIMKGGRVKNRRYGERERQQGFKLSRQACADDHI